MVQFVAPYGSYQALLGTNPIAVGIPREEGKEPIVLDMATAAFPCELTAGSGSVGVATGGGQTRPARTQEHYSTTKTGNTVKLFITVAANVLPYYSWRSRRILAGSRP